MDPALQGLVDGIRARDPAALERLLDRMEPRLLRLASGMLGDPASAADAVQDAFVAVWERIGAFRDGTDLEAWVATLCLNRCRDLLRARARERRALRAVPVRESAPPEAAAPEAGVHRRILDAVAQLPEREREAFLLTAVDGLGSEAAGRALGCTASAVRMALTRARRALAARLKGPEAP